jgi:predicted ATPase
MLLESFGLRNLPESEVYPFNLPLIRNLDSVKLKKPITLFVGENGSGKSTILEALAYAAAIPTAGGMSIEEDPLMQPARDLGKMLSLRFSEKTHSGFFARAEDFFGFVKNILRQIAELDIEMAEIRETWTGGDIEKALSPIKSERKAFTDRYTENLDAMSHGEGFLKFFNARITGKGLYLIDEPEAALSPSRQLSLMLLIHEAVKKREAQFIIATHSPMIITMPGADIMHFKDGQISSAAYADTEHYALTKSFLENPGAYFDKLLEE